MLARAAVILLAAPLAGACGKVAERPPPDAAVDAPPDGPPPRTYKGMLAATTPSRFGGAPYCTYTQTLRDITVELGILPGGQVVSGRAQNLNVEAVVVSTNPDCPADFPVIPPNIGMYTFQSARPSQNGMTLTFRGAASNNPSVDLAIDLTTVGSAVQARMGFHRNDQPAPLDWSVIATLSLSPQ
jgi:hypothetical protein